MHARTLINTEIHQLNGVWIKGWCFNSDILPEKVLHQVIAIGNIGSRVEALLYTYHCTTVQSKLRSITHALLVHDAITDERKSLGALAVV